MVSQRHESPIKPLPPSSSRHRIQSQSPRSEEVVSKDLDTFAQLSISKACDRFLDATDQAGDEAVRQIFFYGLDAPMQTTLFPLEEPLFDPPKNGATTHSSPDRSKSGSSQGGSPAPQPFQGYGCLCASGMNDSMQMGDVPNVHN